MRPVFQTTIDPKNGDCLNACVASLLEIPIERLPHNPPTSGKQLEILREWLAGFGLTVVLINVDGPQKTYAAGKITPGTLMMVSGPSGTFENGLHVVVGKIGEEAGQWDMVHDPNPNGKGIKKAYYYYFFTPMNPKLEL